MASNGNCTQAEIWEIILTILISTRVIVSLFIHTSRRITRLPNAVKTGSQRPKKCRAVLLSFTQSGYYLDIRRQGTTLVMSAGRLSELDLFVCRILDILTFHTSHVIMSGYCQERNAVNIVRSVHGIRGGVISRCYSRNPSITLNRELL